MDLKIKISEKIYEAVKRREDLQFDEIVEIFDAIGNGTPTMVSKNNIGDFEFILNKKEADIFNSLSNEQKEVVCKLLDNAVKQAEEKDKDNGPGFKKEEIDNHVEICRLMTEYLGRKFTPHEGHFMALYKTIEKNKDILAGLKGEDKIIVKMLIRSLVPTEE